MPFSRSHIPFDFSPAFIYIIMTKRQTSIRLTVTYFHTRTQKEETKKKMAKTQRTSLIEPYRVVDEVRVTPKEMIFENAYDGKRFTRKLVFQNCGKHPALVRLASPSSKSVQYEPFPEGYTICAGLKLTRTVTLTFKSATPIERAQCTIYINEKEIEYHFIVHMAEGVITLEPARIDFGRIDANCGNTSRHLIIRNDGYKTTPFSIDLGRNDLNLVVEPMKGHIPAKSFVSVSIEMVGWKEGDFEREFWIKTLPPQRVYIYGTVVAPRLLVKKSIDRLKLVLINFKTMFYGSRMTKLILIKNSSPSPAMFYVMAEVKGKLMSLKQARRINENYKSFEVEPEDGRWGAESGTTIRVSFTPKLTTSMAKYNIAFLRVIRIDCHDITKMIDQTPEMSNHVHNETMFDSRSSVYSAPGSFSSISLSQMYIGDDADREELERQQITNEQTIFVCLHGECELAEIYLRPDVIIITETTLLETEQRELYVRNESTLLPIRVKYTKIPYFDVYPNEFDLKAEEAIEVKVVIKAWIFDHVEALLGFDIFAADHQDDSMWRKVGHNHIRIEFTTNKVKLKGKLKQCCPKTSKISGLDWSKTEYKMNEMQVKRKLDQRSYYKMYTRMQTPKQVMPILADSFSDYDLTDKKLLLNEYMKCTKSSAKAQRCAIVDKGLTLIPLRPKQLYNVKIYPKSINLQKMAPLTSTISSITIENKNKFSIYIYLIASKSHISFIKGNRETINAGETKIINFVFAANSLSTGKFPARIDVIVNMSAVYRITVLVHVMAKFLRISPIVLDFLDNDKPYHFVSVVNGLNSDTCFDWDFPTDYYTVTPNEGCVPAGRSLTCMVQANRVSKMPQFAECIITAESGQKKLVEMEFAKRQHYVTFSTQNLDIGLIPFNTLVTKRVLMRNRMNNSVHYSIPDADPLPGVSITPTEGFLEENDNVIFCVTLMINSVISFSTKFTIIIDEDDDFDLNVKATVDNPAFTLEPDTLVFRKISPYAFDRAVFRIINDSKFPLHISFPMESYPEFTISDKEHHHLPPVESITLEATKWKYLYLHFYPKHVTTYTVYLPYVCNLSIGPVLSGSSHISAYLAANNLIYAKYKNVTFTKIRNNMPYIRLNCCTTEKMISISESILLFNYYCPDHPNNVTTQEIEIANISNQEVTFCIRHDELKEPFELTPISDVHIEEYRLSYLIVLSEGEKVVFEVTYDPIVVGKTYQKLPIFVLNHIDEKVFNFIYLEGNYVLPKIIPSHKILYFEPILPLLKNQITFNLDMQNHFPNCRVNADTDLIELEVTYERTNESTCSMPVTLQVKCPSPCAFDTEVWFRCSCNGTAKVTIKGLVDYAAIVSNRYETFLKSSQMVDDYFANINSSKSSIWSSTSLTDQNFKSTFVNLNSSNYPFFPEDNDNSDIAIIMRLFVAEFEHWMYSQAFFCTSHYHIPDNFIYHFPSEVTNTTGRKQYHEIPLVRFMMNILYDDVRKCLVHEEFDGDLESNDYIVYLHNTYARILEYCEQYNVLIPLIRPEYLLNYEQYTAWMKLRGKTPYFNEDEFQRYSKTCWLNLLSQCFKAFVVHRTPITENIQSKYCQDSFSVDFYLCSEQMMYLYDWAMHIFETERHKYPAEKPLKHIVYLDENLQDGVVLGIVTAKYCPYLNDIIDEMYFTPHGFEQRYNNACQLIKAWNLLNFSYQLTPEFILHLNYFRTILLLSYLRDILPDHEPKESITIRAFLAKTNASFIELENLGAYPINYKATFFGNEKELFLIPKVPHILVAPYKKRKVPIQYYAKHVTNITVHLLFSGETPGIRYGKSICVKVEGIPDIISDPAIDLKVCVEMYKNVKLSTQLTSPYKCEETYRIFTLKTLSMVESMPPDFKLKLANQVYNRFLNEFTTLETFANFDADGNRDVEFELCCLQPCLRKIYIYYLNDTVGDFSATFELSGKLSHTHCEQLDVCVPENYSDTVCTCKKGKIDFTRNCPKIFNINVPAKNRRLWEGINDVILRDCEGPERVFWSKILHMPMGTRIVLSLIQMCDVAENDIQLVLNSSGDYAVVVEKPAAFRTPKTLYIKDVIDEGYVPLPIHPVGQLTAGVTSFLRLNEVDGNEKRIYRVVFYAPRQFSGMFMNKSSRFATTNVHDIEK